MNMIQAVWKHFLRTVVHDQRGFWPAVLPFLGKALPFVGKAFGAYSSYKGAKNQAKGRDPRLLSKTFEDPYKVAVASPMSRFLSQQIGKQMPQYDVPYPGLAYGKDYENRYSEFLGTDPSKFFEEKIAGPTMNRWRKEVLPVVREGYAGSLRGSGRFRGEEESAMDVSKQLTEAGAKFIPGIYSQQLAAGSKRAASEYQSRVGQWKSDYNNWFSSLPINNPAIARSLQFLGQPSGWDMITYGVPGRESGGKNAGLGSLIGDIMGLWKANTGGEGISGLFGGK